ncbi:MAG: hypothetical protein ACLUJG_08700 [Lawsonibacter sp.]
MYQMATTLPAAMTSELLDSMGPFTVIEYQKDLSVMPGSARLACCCNAMNVRKRQVICDLSKANITLPGRSHAVDGGQRQRHNRRRREWATCSAKALRGSVTGERHQAGVYRRHGTLVRRPTYKHISSCWIWPTGAAPSFWADSLFLACGSS